MKKMAVLVGLLALVMATTAHAAAWHQTNFTNQTGGVADSMSAAVDTSSAVTVPIDVTSCFVTSVSDSNAFRYIQVNTSLNRWATIVFDTTNVVSGNLSKGRVSADLAPYLRGRNVRVLMDRTKSSAGWAQNWISWLK
jgi:hypothetical protein